MLSLSTVADALPEAGRAAVQKLASQRSFETLDAYWAPSGRVEFLSINVCAASAADRRLLAAAGFGKSSISIERNRHVIRTWIFEPEPKRRQAR